MGSLNLGELLYEDILGTQIKFCFLSKEKLSVYGCRVMHTVVRREHNK